MSEAREKLRRTQWAIVGLAAMAIAALEVFYFAVKGVPLPECILDWAMGMAIALALVQLCFHIVYEVHDQLLHRANQLATLDAVATSVSRSLNLGEVLNEALDKVLEVTGLESGAIYLWDRASGELKLTVHRGLSEEFVRQVSRMRLGEGVTGRAAMSGEPIVVDEYVKDRRALPAAMQENLRAMVSMPLKSKDKVLGVMNIASRRERRFAPWEVQLLTSIGNQIGVAIENAQLFDEIREREKQLAYQLENASDAIFNVDLAGRFTFFNRAAEVISGYRREEVLGRPFTDLLCPEYHQEMLAILRRGAGEEPGRTYEVEFFDKWGERVPLEITITTLKKEGRPIGGQVVARDIRERKRLENELLEFMASISHNLRTPLASIMSFSEILLSYEDENPETRREFLNIIYQESQKLAKVLEETLDISRLGREKHGQKDSNR